MICKACMKNVATVKFTEVVDGNAIQHNLCRDCFEAHQRNASGFSVDVPRPGSRAGGQSPTPTQTEETTRCVSCGTSLNRIRESAEVGCAACYTTYGQEIESMLEALHRGLVHRGKTFAGDDERSRLSIELQAKRLLLRSVLKAENYEEAARLRDEIALLEQKSRAGEVSVRENA